MVERFKVLEVVQQFKVLGAVQRPRALEAVPWLKAPGVALQLRAHGAAPRRKDQAGARRFGAPLVGLLPEGLGVRLLLVQPPQPVEVGPTTGM